MSSGGEAETRHSRTGMRFALDTSQIGDDYRTQLEAQMFREVGKELRRIVTNTDDPELGLRAEHTRTALAAIRKRWFGE